MPLQLVSGPTAEPITLAEAIAHIKPSESALENERIALAVSAVRQLAEQELLRSLGPTTWRLTLDDFPDAIRLDNPPITSVTSVKYIDEDGVQQTMDASDYRVDSESEPGWIVPAYGESWPSIRPVINAVEVIYVSGYATASAVPAAVKQWMLAMLRTAYDNPGAFVVGTIAPARFDYIDRLLDRYRVQRA